MKEQNTKKKKCLWNQATGLFVGLLLAGGALIFYNHYQAKYLKNQFDKLQAKQAVLEQQQNQFNNFFRENNGKIIVESGSEFYSSQFGHLLMVIAIFGLAVPFMAYTLQQKSLKEEKNDLKDLLEKEREEFKEDKAKLINKITAQEAELQKIKDEDINNAVKDAEEKINAKVSETEEKLNEQIKEITTLRADFEEEILKNYNRTIYDSGRELGFSIYNVNDQQLNNPVYIVSILVKIEVFLDKISFKNSFKEINERYIRNVLNILYKETEIIFSLTRYANSTYKAFKEMNENILTGLKKIHSHDLIAEDDLDRYNVVINKIEHVIKELDEAIAKEDDKETKA